MDYGVGIPVYKVQIVHRAFLNKLFKSVWIGSLKCDLIQGWWIRSQATLPNLRPIRCRQACKTRPYLARIMNVLPGFGDQIIVCLVVVRFGSRWSHFADN
eukprot:sb/3478724/